MQEPMPSISDDRQQHQPTMVRANGSLLRAQPFTAGVSMLDAAHASSARTISCPSSLLVNPSSFGQMSTMQEPMPMNHNNDRQQHQRTTFGGANGRLLLAQQKQQHLRQQLSRSFANQQQVSYLNPQQQVLSSMPSQKQLRQMRIEDIEDNSPSFATLMYTSEGSAQQDATQVMNRSTSAGEQPQRHQNLLEMALMLQQQQQQQEYSTNASQLSQSQFEQDMLLAELAGREKIMGERRTLLEQRELLPPHNGRQALQHQELFLLKLQSRNNLSNGSPQDHFQDFSNAHNQNQMNNLFSPNSNNF